MRIESRSLVGLLRVSFLLVTTAIFAPACASSPAKATMPATPSNTPPERIAQPISSLRFVAFADLAARHGLYYTHRGGPWGGRGQVARDEILSAASSSQGDDRAVLTWLAEQLTEFYTLGSGAWVDDDGRVMRSVSDAPNIVADVNFELAKTRVTYLPLHKDLEDRGFALAPYLSGEDEEIHDRLGLTKTSTSALELVITALRLRQPVYAQNKFPIAAIVMAAHTGTIVILAIDEICRGDVKVFWIPDQTPAFESDDDSTPTLEPVETYLYYDESIPGCDSFASRNFVTPALLA